jgi:hypothetical protein
MEVLYDRLEPSAAYIADLSITTAIPFLPALPALFIAGQKSEKAGQRQRKLRGDTARFRQLRGDTRPDGQKTFRLFLRPGNIFTVLLFRAVIIPFSRYF